MHHLKKTVYATLVAATISCSAAVQEIYALGENESEERIVIGQEDRFWDVIEYLETYADVQNLHVSLKEDGLSAQS